MRPPFPIPAPPSAPGFGAAALGLALACGPVAARQAQTLLSETFCFPGTTCTSGIAARPGAAPTAGLEPGTPGGRTLSWSLPYGSSEGRLDLFAPDGRRLARADLRGSSGHWTWEGAGNRPGLVLAVLEAGTWRASRTLVVW